MSSKNRNPAPKTKNEWRKMKSEFRDLKDALKAALREKIDAPIEEKQRVLAVLKQALADIRKQ